MTDLLPRTDPALKSDQISMSLKRIERAQVLMAATKAYEELTHERLRESLWRLGGDPLQQT